jgi:carbonic anhydrase
MKWILSLGTLVALAACANEEPLSYVGESAFISSALDEPEQCPPAAQQSPINLTLRDARYTNLPDLDFRYNDSPVDIRNTGHSIQYTYAPGSVLSVGGIDYTLVQFHFHAHSEHAIRNRHQPLELHLVHKGPNEQLLVVGVLIKQGRENPTLADAEWSEIPGAVDATVQFADVTYNAGEFIPDGPTYRYNGSLTAPPCSSNVQWIVYDQPIHASRRQIQRFTALYPESARPLQPREGRSVVYGE